MDKGNNRKNNDLTDFSLLKELVVLDKNYENNLKRRNESEIEFELNQDLDFHSKTGFNDLEDIDYEVFKKNLEKENFHSQLQDFARKGDNLNRKKYGVREEIKEENEEENERKEEVDKEKSKEDFVPWILVFVGSLIGMSLLKRAFTD